MLFRFYDHKNKKMVYQGVNERKDIFWSLWEKTAKASPAMASSSFHDKNGKVVYSCDFVKYYEPRRDYQDHYGENIPRPDGHYREKLEPAISEKIVKVIFDGSSFIVEGKKDEVFDKSYFDFISPFNRDYKDPNQVLDAFCTDNYGEWEVGEDCDLEYLLGNYNIENYEKLIELISSIEVVGNSYENDINAFRTGTSCAKELGKKKDE